MRKSKPAAMCMKDSDLFPILQKSVPTFMPGFFGYQAFDEETFRNLTKDAINLTAFIPRVDCEVDPSYRQFIPYSVIESSDGKILVYNRQGKESSEGESRLAGAASIGFGGHVDIQDYGNPVSLMRPLRSAVYRELQEELYHCDAQHKKIFEEFEYEIEWKGIIRSFQTGVDSVHLGVIALVKLYTHSVQMGITERQRCGFYSNEPDQIQNLRWVDKQDLVNEPNMESWSQHLINSQFFMKSKEV